MNLKWYTKHFYILKTVHSIPVLVFFYRQRNFSIHLIERYCNNDKALEAFSKTQARHAPNSFSLKNQESGSILDDFKQNNQKLKQSRILHGRMFLTQFHIQTLIVIWGHKEPYKSSRNLIAMGISLTDWANVDSKNRNTRPIVIDTTRVPELENHSVLPSFIRSLFKSNSAWLLYVL